MKTILQKKKKFLNECFLNVSLAMNFPRKRTKKKLQLARDKAKTNSIRIHKTHRIS